MGRETVLAEIDFPKSLKTIKCFEGSKADQALKGNSGLKVKYLKDE